MKRERFVAGASIGLATLAVIAAFALKQEFLGEEDNQDNRPGITQSPPFLAPFPTSIPQPDKIDSENSENKGSVNPESEDSSEDNSEDDSEEPFALSAFAEPDYSSLKELGEWDKVKRTKGEIEFKKDFKDEFYADITGYSVKVWDIKKDFGDYADSYLWKLQLPFDAYEMVPPIIQVPGGALFISMEKSGPDSGGIDMLRYTAIYLVNGKSRIIDMRITNPKNPEEMAFRLQALAALEAVIKKSVTG